MTNTYLIWPLLLVAQFNSSLTYAGEWTLTPKVNPSFEYDDNVLMRTSNERGSSIIEVSPSLETQFETEKLSFTSDVGYNVQRYSSLSYLNESNPFVNLKLGETLERASWAVSAKYNKDSTRNNAADDTGDFTTQSIVTTRSVSPSYSYLLTERDTISLSGQYSERTYSTNDYGDNETYNLALNWLRRYSEKLSYGINFSSRNYKSDSASVSTDSDDYSLSLTLDYLFNEQLTVSGSVGARYVNGEQNYSDVGIRHYSDLGQFLDIKLNKSLERDRLSLGLSRTVSPSSTGQVNEIDKISVSYSHDITEKLVGNLNSSYQETRSATEEDNDKRENIDFTSSLNWHVDEKLQLKLSYKYRKQTQTNRDDADSNRIMLSLDYNWDDYSLSP
jgi:hypothetical protein